MQTHPTPFREGAAGARAQLRETASLEEILRIAMSFETAAREFYVSLAAADEESIRDLATELAEEEGEHLLMLQHLAEQPTLRANALARVGLPPIHHAFLEQTFPPPRARTTTAGELIRYAIAREKAAMLQYLGLAEEAAAGPARDLFRYLGEEELRHMLNLQFRYRALLQPANTT